MEGSYFYFFSWCGWIVSTFFIGRSSFRLKSAVCILLLIISAPLSITIVQLPISVGSLLLFCMCVLGIRTCADRMKLYSILCSTILGMLYAAVHLIELYDPVWIVMNRIWLLSILLVYAACLLVEAPLQRTYILCMGMLQGELLLELSLRPYGFRSELGSLSFFDTLACAMFLLCVLSVLFQRIFFSQLFRQKQVRERQG